MSEIESAFCGPCTAAKFTQVAANNRQCQNCRLWFCPTHLAAHAHPPALGTGAWAIWKPWPGHERNQGPQPEILFLVGAHHLSTMHDRQKRESHRAPESFSGTEYPSGREVRFVTLDQLTPIAETHPLVVAELERRKKAEALRLKREAAEAMYDALKMSLEIECGSEPGMPPCETQWHHLARLALAKADGKT